MDTKCNYKIIYLFIFQRTHFNYFLYSLNHTYIFCLKFVYYKCVWQNIHKLFALPIPWTGLHKHLFRQANALHKLINLHTLQVLSREICWVSLENKSYMIQLRVRVWRLSSIIPTELRFLRETDLCIKLAK